MNRRELPRGSPNPSMQADGGGGRGVMECRVGGRGLRSRVPPGLPLRGAAAERQQAAEHVRPPICQHC